MDVEIKSKETDSSSTTTKTSPSFYHQQSFVNVINDKIIQQSPSSSSSCDNNVTRSEPSNQINGSKPEPVIINSVPSLKDLSENCLTVNHLINSTQQQQQQPQTTTKMHLKTKLLLQSKSLAVDSNNSNRPIYPNCPFSPYASPTNSPRSNRKRQPMKESRRVSIEKNGLYIQLNQYKLMDSIGQVSYIETNHLY